jgi:hypothetical protein
MGHIVSGKNILAQPPQPGRPVTSINQEVIKETVVVEKETAVDVDSIAAKVVEALGDKLSKIQVETVHETKRSGDFDDSKTMEQLAKSMTVQRSNSSSNFDNLGNVAETKKDKEEVDQTINILSGIED